MALITQYDKQGNLIESINIAATSPVPSGITTDRKYLWINELSGTQIQQYDKQGNLIDAFVVPIPTEWLGDITTDRKY